MRYSSLRKPIPYEMRLILSDDPFMKSCCLESLGCSGKIEWHHAATYAGQRINELWAILPLCSFHHRLVGKLYEPIRKVLQKRIKHFMAEQQVAEKYPKLKI